MLIKAQGQGLFSALRTAVTNMAFYGLVVYIDN